MEDTRAGWIPYQVAHEYFENRTNVVREQAAAYADVIKNIDAIDETFSKSTRHPFVSDAAFEKLRQFLNEIKKEMGNSRSALEGLLTRDETLESVAKVFEGRVGDELPEDEIEALFTEGEFRFKERIPPGWADAKKAGESPTKRDLRRKFGDLIVWKETLRKAKESEASVIFVTGDQKEDWWEQVSGKIIGPQPELVDEFWRETQKEVLFYSLHRFLAYANERNVSRVSEETVSEIRHRQENDRRAELKALRAAQRRQKWRLRAEEARKILGEYADVEPPVSPEIAKLIASGTSHQDIKRMFDDELRQRERLNVLRHYEAIRQQDNDQRYKDELEQEQLDEQDAKDED